MKRISSLIILAFILLSACNPSPEARVTLTDTAQTATAVAWTETPSPTQTFTSTFTPSFTPSFTPTFTLTPTITLTPTLTPTPTLTFTPTFEFPRLTVNVANLACLFGPAKAYLWKFGLHQGDTGVVWGRAPIGPWLYVKMDLEPDGCWLHPAYVDIVGDINTLAVQEVRLWITDALYSAPKHVRASRKGDEVTVKWDQVEMTEDDDRGYFLDVYVCQKGNYVWMPTSFPNQYTTSTTFTDEAGCSFTSGGKIYTVEKHGYTSPVDIPWPTAK
jgi:hypothetical protein